MQRNAPWFFVITVFIPFAAMAASPETQLKEWRNGVDFGCAQMGPLETIETMATNGSIDAQVYMGWAHWQGTKCGTAKDESVSKTWVSLAAEQGDPEAQFALGYYFDNGIKFELPSELFPDTRFDVGGNTDRVGQDDEKAVEWTARAANQGYAPAIAAIGQYYFQGVVVESDHTEAFNFFMNAAKRGYADAWVGVASVLFESTRTAYIMNDTETFEQTSVLTMMYFILSDELRRPPTNRLPHNELFNEYYAIITTQTLLEWMSPGQEAEAWKNAEEVIAHFSQ